MHTEKKILISVTVVALLFFCVAVAVFMFKPINIQSQETQEPLTFTAISAGFNHSMAIDTNGTLWGWGANDRGQLGDGTTGDRHSPVRIMDDVVAVSAGHQYTMAIQADNSLWAWGSNDSGRIGDGTRTWWASNSEIVENNDRNTPVRIMDNVVGAFASDCPIAITEDGMLWAWGIDSYGYAREPQLPDDSDFYTPTRVRRDIPYDAFTANGRGVIGNGGSILRFEIKIRRGSLVGEFVRREGENSNTGRELDVIAASVGRDFTSAIADDNSLWSFGSHVSIPFEGGRDPWASSPCWHDPETAPSIMEELLQRCQWCREPQPRRDDLIKVLEDVITVSTGSSHAMAIKNDGSLWAWGGNGYGQVGNGTATVVYRGGYIDYGGGADEWIPEGYYPVGGVGTPTRVMDNVIAISTGPEYSMALHADGSIWAWGRNDRGQLGDGLTEDRHSPTRILFSLD
jgi:alpha-tubulin suppressor-like RCC1 family protein